MQPTNRSWLASLSALGLCFFSIVSSTTPSYGAPTLSELRFLPGDEVLAPAAGKQLNPEIAPGGSGYLLVWVDDRTAITPINTFSGGPAFDHHIGSMWDIYAARVDADGNLVDQTPIIVAEDVQNQGLVDVAWNGQDWLVIWSGQIGMQCCPDVNRYAARVSPDGVVLDTPPITLATGDLFANAMWPATVGSDGTNWAVVWTRYEETGTLSVIGMRVGPDGAVLDPGGVPIHTGGSPGDFDITFAGGEYFLIWSSGGMTGGGTVLGKRLQPDLASIGGAFPINLYTPTVGLNCRVATNGTDYFVAWWEDRYYGWAQLMGARVSGDGTVLDPGGLALTEPYGYTNYEPAVEWDGTNYVVVCDRSAFPPIDLFATRVSAAGQVLDYDLDAIPISTAADRQWEAAIAHAAGGQTVVVWRDGRHGSEYLGDIYARTLAPDGALGPEACVALGAPRQTHLRLVPNGAGYLAVFRSETSPQTRILAQRTDGTGQALDAEPVVVASGGSEIKNPSAAWNGSSYLVVWENSTTNRIFGIRLDSGLLPMDPLPVELMPGNTPDVAAVGDVFLVVTSYEQPHEIRQIYSLRVRGSDGQVLDASPALVGQNFSLYPRVASFAGRWLVVWERRPTHDDPFAAAYANFVEATGAPGSYFLVGYGELPVAASGPDQALVAWQDDGASDGLDVFVRRLLPDGTMLDPFGGIPVTTLPRSQFDTAAGWDGTEYVTAFGDFRNDELLESHRGDLYGARIGKAGDVIDPDGFVISNESIPEMFPDAAGFGGHFMIGGSVFRVEAGYLAYRIALVVESSEIATEIAEGTAADLKGPRVALSPNPTSGSATIFLRLATPERLSVGVYDIAGREVRRLFDGSPESQSLQLTWDGRNGSGRRSAPGTYFVRIQSASNRAVAKLILL